ncbi:hypothetical protein FQA47_010116 [Oryzias melastigma]|uniref:Uncharacterized protein n=1 Tax=Oryzias melastigma TaxID=30732 RepID=A0A834FHS0_ORYME|nr:hypothetical protein FQA47_010116 [Oryzias melastigma]
MNNRERWRFYKRATLMFFLAAVTLTVVHRGSIDMKSRFELERQVRMHVSDGAEPSAALKEEPTFLAGAKQFWNIAVQRQNLHHQQQSELLPTAPAGEPIKHRGPQPDHLGRDQLEL